jgi:hypothetical protein
VLSSIFLTSALKLYVYMTSFRMRAWRTARRVFSFIIISRWFTIHLSMASCSTFKAFTSAFLLSSSFWTVSTYMTKLVAIIAFNISISVIRIASFSGRMTSFSSYGSRTLTWLRTRTSGSRFYGGFLIINIKILSFQFYHVWSK